MAVDSLNILDQTIKLQVKANQLNTITDLLVSNPAIKILSLDCFDTILWRKSASPQDIFFDLQNHPSFKKLDFTARLRIQSEEIARNKKIFKYASSEVKLIEIYQANFPNLSHEDYKNLEEAEVMNDMNYCYAFPGLIKLINFASDIGKKIIIVSDSYYTSLQIKRLLLNSIPNETVDKIEYIFSSSDFGQSKVNGLMKHVLKYYNCAPSSVLHLGDHLIADFETAVAHGMHAIHLLHYEQPLLDLLRLQASALSFNDQSIQNTRSLDLPFRGHLASAQIDTGNSEQMLGYAVLGPIMYAFADFINNKMTEIRQTHQPVKVLYLMRDGYLPYLAVNAFCGKTEGNCIRISRFATYAASFTSKEDIDRYLSDNIISFRFYDMCKQLLLPKKLTNEILSSLKTAKDPVIDFLISIRKEKVIKKIISNSAAYRERLFKHLQKDGNVQVGDKIVFIDLGYTGTTQIKLQKLFKEKYQIDIYGIYLISFATPDWRENRCGLIDPSWCDERVIHMLVSYIALIEQLCTKSESSVVDYAPDGEPIYGEAQLATDQHQKLSSIQHQCINFINDFSKFRQSTRFSLNMQHLRDAVLSSLTRILFFPTQQELDFLKSFQFELNLGTNELMDLFDSDKGLTSLRRRGLFFMERNLNSMRTNYPAELRSAGLELSFILMGQHRFGYDLRLTDLSLRRETINIIAISLRDNSTHQYVIASYPTYDGYFSLTIPVGKNEFQIGVQFGLRYEFIQLEAIDLVPAKVLLSFSESNFTRDVSQDVISQDMSDEGQGLFKCQSRASLLMYIPNQTDAIKVNHALRIIFRPITNSVA